MKGKAGTIPVVFPSMYLPPVSEIMKLAAENKIFISSGERFVKSTWRNRCRIANANGKLMLSIPLKGGRGVRCAISEVLIDYDSPWQRVHWNSLRTAYGKSAYFQFYAERFEMFYEKRFDRLIDFNNHLLRVIIGCLNWNKELIETREHKPAIDKPKNSPDIRFPEYHQVFIEKNGFIPDLSVVDLIFNLGPEAHRYLSPG